MCKKGDKVILEKLRTKYLEKDKEFIGKTFSNKPEVFISQTDIGKDYVIIDNHKFIKFEGEEKLKGLAGVYVFVAKNDFSFNVKEVLEKFVTLYCEENEIKVYYPSSPKLNFFKNESKKATSVIQINRGELIYVGKEGNLKSRYLQHYSNKLDHTSALKLPLRKIIEQNVVFYYTVIEESEKRTEVEKEIRKKYCPRFGR